MYIFLISMLAIVSCTKKSPVDVNVVGLKAELREAQYSLAACQTKLSANGSGSFNNPPEVEEPSAPDEPQYETVEAFILNSKSTNTTCYEQEVETCGMTFYDCKDGYVYRCLQDARYKITEEQKLIK